MAFGFQSLFLPFRVLAVLSASRGRISSYTVFSRQPKDRGHSHQIVSSPGEDGLRLHHRQSDESCLAQAADGLGPAEEFFHQLAFFKLTA